MANLKVIIAVDSFKGSATSKEVENFIENGILKFKKDNIIIKKIPIADGGEGTVEAIVEATSGEYKYLDVTGPLGEKVSAKFGIIKNNIAVMEMAEASGIISQKANYKFNQHNAKTYPIKTFIDKLPGYTAQNMTFELMIGFLFAISLIIIAVFLYILTMQKMHNFAVMRAQGIPSKTLVGATISQSIILVVVGVVIALIAMWITALILPASVPLLFTPEIMVIGSLGMLIMGIIGSLIPIRSILKVDPAKAIGE